MTPDGPVQHLRYSRDELRRFWADAGMQTPVRERTLVLRIGAEDAALELSAIWHRRFCALPGSIGWAYGELTAYLQHVQGDWQAFRERWKRQVYAYELAGADEGGPLFSDPGERAIDPLPLMQALQLVLLEAPEIQTGLRSQIVAAIEKAYV